ncbi:MAG: NUDIX hydrolase [Candidatus Nanohaloarchaea archaeon]
MAEFICGTRVICRNEDSEILMVREGQEKHRGKWDFPGGGLEHDETVKESAEREVKEETGFLVESNGFYGCYMVDEDLGTPAIAFLVSAENVGKGEKKMDAEEEIIEHGFFSPVEIRKLEIRQPSRLKMLEDVLTKEPIDIDRIKDLRP